MRKFVLGLVSTAAVLLVSAPAAAGPNLVENGNFEQNLARWTVFPGSEIVAAKGSAYTAIGGSGSVASRANTMAAFGGGQRENVSSLFSAAFQTVAGTTYRLTFDYAQYGGTPGQERLSYGVFTDNSGTLLRGTKVPTASSTGTNLDTIFANYRYNYFVGNGELARVFFSISGQATNNTDGLLDNVVITAIPEASTWALMIVGLGGTGISLRRRRRSASAFRIATV